MNGQDALGFYLLASPEQADKVTYNALGKHAYAYGSPIEQAMAGADAIVKAFNFSTAQFENILYMSIYSNNQSLVHDMCLYAFQPYTLPTEVKRKQQQEQHSNDQMV